MKWLGLVLLIALAGCKQTEEFPGSSPEQLSRVIFRTKGTREFYKIKSIKETFSKKSDPLNLGEVTASGWAKTFDIEVELIRDCYNPMGLKKDLLAVCSDAGDVAKMKKAGEVAQLKQVDVGCTAYTKGSQESFDYSLKYNGQLYF